jgi:hypothetical protein
MKCEDCEYTIPCYNGKLLLGSDKAELCVRCGKFFPHNTKMSHWFQPSESFICELRRVTPDMRQRCEGDSLKCRTSFQMDDPGPTGGKIRVTTCLNCRKKGKPLRATIGDLLKAKGHEV